MRENVPTPSTAAGADVAGPTTAAIEEAIAAFLASPANALSGGLGPAWGTALVGYSRGDDPLYLEYKGVVGPFHLTPAEIFALTFPDLAGAPSELSLISWVLPQTAEARAANARARRYPAERWARSKHEGEQVNVALRRHVEQVLAAAGVAAVAPVSSPHFSVQRYPTQGWASTWSERHAAYAAGLGTFGLSDGLITPVGKAMRCGSVVARLSLPASLRPYTDRHAYCLHFSEGTCGGCVRRCPVGAITLAGHDKDRCSASLEHLSAHHVRPRFGFATTVCGLSQTGVPCEAGIPIRVP